MYHISTTWMQVVPKLNPKGRDLLQVNIYFAILRIDIILRVIRDQEFLTTHIQMTDVIHTKYSI